MSGHSSTLLVDAKRALLSCRPVIPTVMAESIYWRAVIPQGAKQNATPQPARSVTRWSYSCLALYSVAGINTTAQSKAPGRNNVVKTNRLVVANIARMKKITFSGVNCRDILNIFLLVT